MTLGPVEALRAPGERLVHQLSPDREDGWPDIEGAARLAFDLETDGFFAYRERVCLLQIGTEDADWLYDPLDDGARALPEALTRALQRPDRPLVGHALDNDVRALDRDFGFRPGAVFDTALAARVLGHGLPLGLEGLLRAVLGVEVDKSQQRSDWSRRPLTEAQLRYARQDIVHLLPLADALTARLQEVERLGWHLEECRRVLEVPPADHRFDPEGWRRVKSAKTLGVRGRAVMATLWRWREREAEARNVAPFRVLHPEQVARIARTLEAKGERALARLPGAGVERPRFDVERLRAAAAEGLSAEDPGPRRTTPAGPRGEPLDDEAKQRLARLREARGGWSAELGLDPGFLLPQSVLERVARRAPEDEAGLEAIEGVAGWRRQVLGQEIIRALQ